MKGLKSFSFQITHQGGGTALSGLPGVVLTEISGAVVKPESMRVKLVGLMGSLMIKLELVTVEGASYMTNPLGGQWQRLEAGVNPLGFFDPQQGIAAIMSGVEQSSYLGREKVAGEATFHIEGVLDASNLGALVGETAEGELIQAEIWLGAGDLLLRRARLSGKVTPTEERGVVRIITPADFNQPLDIEPPM